MAMSDRPENSPGAPVPPRSALAWADHAGRAERLVAELRHRQRRRRLRRVSAAAVAALALVAAGLWWPRPHDLPALASPPVVLRPERQILPDGTHVDLRPGARLAVEFSPAVRRVALLAGEAHFSVTSDPARPFVVQAAGIEVRAVGTAFAVQLVADGVSVLVTEGRVALDAPAAATPRTLATLDAGKQARIPAAALPAPIAEVSHLAAADLAAQLAWRAPRLEFSATPLVDAIALFNRYSATRLVLGEPRLGSLQISGIVRADHPDTLVQLLEANYSVRAQPAGDTLILVPHRR
jgi:transmembrane sensor